MNNEADGANIHKNNRGGKCIKKTVELRRDP